MGGHKVCKCNCSNFVFLIINMLLEISGVNSETREDMQGHLIAVKTSCTIDHSHVSDVLLHKLLR